MKLESETGSILKVVKERSEALLLWCLNTLFRGCLFGIIICSDYIILDYYNPPHISGGGGRRSRGPHGPLLARTDAGPT